MLFRSKAQALTDTGAATFVTADGGCLLNIQGKLAKADGGACPGATCGLQGQHLASFLCSQLKTGGRA